MAAQNFDGNSEQQLAIRASAKVPHPCHHMTLKSALANHRHGKSEEDDNQQEAGSWIQQQ